MTACPRVGFDALFLEQPMTGAGQYATHLWRQLRGHQDEVEPWLLQPADAPADACAYDAAACSVQPPRPLRSGYARKLWWEQVGLVAATRRSGAALVHVPYFSAPLRQRVPHIVTIHDVIPLALPVYASTRRMRLYLRLVTRSARRARLVLTDSQHARADIVRYLGIPLERVRVTPLAASEAMLPVRTAVDEAAVARTRERLGLTRPFVLNVGGFDVRKRLPQLVRAFARALASLPEPLDLVIAGRAHTGNTRLYPPIEPLLAELGIAGQVRLVGFVDEETKRDLYRAAELFVFASEYEGFGLTPLEALACGAPVVCSNRSSLPEVVGDAGLLVDPEPEPLARAMVQVLSSPELRADLAARGPKRAAHFTWERTARLTLDAYREVLEGR